MSPKASTTNPTPSDGINLDAIESALKDRLAEAASLRDSIPMDYSESNPSSLIRALTQCRRVLDRYTGILAELTQLRTRLQEKSAVAKAVMEDEWDAVATRPAGASFSQREPAPRERYAKYNLATVEQQRALRRANSALRSIEGTLEVCRLFNRAVESIRQDIRTLITYTQWESHLER